MYTPDAATDTFSTPVAPAAANATSDTAPSAPPDPTASATAPAAPPPMPVAPSSSAPPPPSKATFAENFQRGINGPQYQANGEGQIQSSAPARNRSAGGILGSILSGALEGAVRGVAAPTPEGARGRGAAVSAGANAAMKGAKEADDRARAIAQRNFENQQAATEQKVRVNRELAETAHIAQNMQFEKEEHPGILKSRELENQGLEIAHQGAMDRLNKDAYDFAEEMAKNGAPSTLFTQHGPELNAQVAGAVAGDTVAATNGIQGKGAGINTWHAADLTVPFTGQPVTINKYDKGVDKDGVPIPNPTVFTPDGKTTLTDLKNAYFQGRSQLYQMLQSHATKMANETQKADLAEKGAKAKEETAGAAKDYATANLSNAQAKQINDIHNMSTTPAGYTPPPNALTMSPQELGNYIQSKGGTVPNDLPAIQSVARYDASLESFPTTPRRGDPRPSRSDVVNYIVANINPAFKESEFKSRQGYLKDFEGSKSGEGATRDRLNTAVQHLDLLGSAATAVEQNNIPLLNTIANQYGIATGKDPAIVYKGIANKAAGELAGAIKGGSGSATDQEIDKALQSFDPNMSPQQQASNIRTQMQLLLGAENTIKGHFTDTMGQAPEAMGHSVLFGENQAKMNKWVASGTAPTGGAVNPNAGGQQQQPSRAFTTPQGTSFPLDQNGQFTANGWVYQASPDLKQATPLHAAPQGH